jgi:NAD(P)H-hydrate epimerase
LYIVTTQQMEAAEKAADASGLSYDRMMENAGHAVAKAIEAQFEIVGVRVLILVGPGNNGGDGLVVARYLAQMGAVVTVYVWKRNVDGDKNWALLDPTGVERVFMTDRNSQARLTHLLKNTGIVVDALLGTGVSRPIEGDLADLLDQVKAAVADLRAQRETDLVDPAYPKLTEAVGPVVVAVDVPSGLNSDTGDVDPHTLPADLTVTLAAVKAGQILMPGPEVVGQLMVGDIGITAEYYPEDISLEMATSTQVAAWMPDRSPGSHKGTFGTALIVAGSRNYTGAAVLAGQAAARIGTGLVTLTPPRFIQSILASQLAEATYLPLPDDDGALTPEAVSMLKPKFSDAEAILIGPGFGQADSTAAFLLELLADADSLPPAIFDADALNLLAKQDNWWNLLPAKSILTPHPGEMSRLTGQSVKEVQASRLEIAADMAAKWNQIVLLKGPHTIVAEPDGRTVVLPFANPALAKAGSGDVLAGTLVGLLAQGLEAFEAAVAGAYFHGLAGELARTSLGATATIAGDLVGYLPLAIQQVTGD